MKVGDLVKFRHDSYGLFGHGVVLEMASLGGQVRIRWFDDWDDEEIAWETTSLLEVISES
tara:strand:- start:140 stop:319 length:180 start_codon:yes stop_codon:yes gene_type:complete